MDEPNLTVRRATLQARLAAERAGFLYQLRGLDEESLCTAPIGEGGTARDMFAHLGYWDAFYADRIQYISDGRRDEIKPLEGDAEIHRLNAEARQHFGRLDLGQAVAIAVKERNGFLATLARTTDDLLYRRIQLAPGWRVTPATWARWRYKHDAEHATEAGRWRRSYRSDRDPRPPASKVILRPFLGASRQEFMSLAALVVPDQRSTRPVCGPWTLRDVIGHLAVHEFMGVTALKDLTAGQSPEYPKTVRNFDTFNEAQVLARQGIGWAQTIDEYRAVRQALVTLLDNLSEEELVRPFVAPWGSPITGYQYLFGLAIHEQEHAAVLRNTLHLRPLPKRLRHYRAA